MNETLSSENKSFQLKPSEDPLDQGIDVEKGMYEMGLIFDQGAILVKKTNTKEKYVLARMDVLRIHFKNKYGYDGDSPQYTKSLMNYYGDVLFGFFRDAGNKKSNDMSLKKTHAVLDYLWGSYKNIMLHTFYILILEMEDKDRTFNSYQFNAQGVRYDNESDNIYETLMVGYQSLKEHPNDQSLSSSSRVLRKASVLINSGAQKRREVTFEAQQWLDDELKEMQTKTDLSPTVYDPSDKTLPAKTEAVPKVERPVKIDIKDYETSMQEYQQSFEQFINAHHQLTPLRPYVSRMIDKVKEKVEKIKTHFADRNMTVSPEKVKTLLKENWLKGFMHSPHFPVRGTDEETLRLKQELESVFMVLCDIELMKE